MPTVSSSGHSVDIETGTTGRPPPARAVRRLSAAGQLLWAGGRRLWASVRGRLGPSRAVRPPDPGAHSLLLRTLCHELRSPIGSLRALTRALAEQEHGEPGGYGPGQRRGIAGLAQEQAAHLESLLRQAVSVMQSLAEPSEPPVPLSLVLPAAVTAGSTASTDGAEQRLTIQLSYAAGNRPVHARRVRQILVNLVDNALRHGPPRGQVRVSASVRAGALVLVVADEGGNSRPLRAALRRDAPPPGVSGLGLWIVRQLVAAEGGSIAAYRAARGVAVRVTLPAPQAAPLAPAGGPG